MTISWPDGDLVSSLCDDPPFEKSWLRPWACFMLRKPEISSGHVGLWLLYAFNLPHLAYFFHMLYYCPFPLYLRFDFLLGMGIITM